MPEGNYKTEVIAEIGQAHDGSLGMLHAYIDALHAVGVRTIKFQTHIAEAESSEHEQFRVKFSYQDQTRYDYWKRMEFSADQWQEVFRHCESLNIDFLSTPFSVAAVELLEKLGVKRYKVGSGDVHNPLLLEAIAQKGRPVLLSSGMSSFAELDAAVGILKKHQVPYALFQCTTAYPTSPEQIGLNVIAEMRERYSCDVGLSDHSGTIFPGLAAATLGAKYVEVHSVFDKSMFGPDVSSSLTMDQMRDLVEGCASINTMLNHPIDKSRTEDFAHVRDVFSRSLAVRKDLPAGHTLAFEDLESKKPAGQGIPTDEYLDYLGKSVKKDIKSQSFLTKEDFA